MSKLISKAIFLLLLVVLALGGCNGEAEDPHKIQIIATIYPLYEFAKEVGGEKVEVHLLLPPGSEAHSFDPKPSDIQKIERARLVIYVGESLEPWMHDILEGVAPQDLSILEAGDVAQLMYVDEEEHAEEEEEHEDEPAEDDAEEEEHDHDGLDPHFWLDFDRDRKVVSEIARQLSSIDPDNTNYYYQNSAKYQAKLLALDAQYSEELANCDTRTFIVNHDSFSYLAARYDLEQLAVFGISPDREPNGKVIKEIIDLARSKNLTVVFFESLVNPGVAESIANDIGGATLTLNPGENFDLDEIAREQQFLVAMGQNLENLKIGLKCR